MGARVGLIGSLSNSEGIRLKRCDLLITCDPDAPARAFGAPCVSLARPGARRLLPGVYVVWGDPGAPGQFPAALLRLPDPRTVVVVIPRREKVPALFGSATLADAVASAESAESEPAVLAEERERQTRWDALIRADVHCTFIELGPSTLLELRASREGADAFQPSETVSTAPSKPARPAAEPVPVHAPNRHASRHAKIKTKARQPTRKPQESR